MRLSEWRAKAPFKNSVSPRVVAVVESALAVLGGERDPECWIVWGDDPTVRYLLLAPTPSGLVQVHVRVYVPGEGPRASGKVMRWSRVQLGELAVEIQGGHRLVTFQVETQVLNGADDAADRIADFAQALFAAVDGRAAWTSGVRKASPWKPAAKASASVARATPRKASSARASSATSRAAKATPATQTPSAGRPEASAVPRLAASKGTRP